MDHYNYYVMKEFLVSTACVLLPMMVLNGCATSQEKAAKKAEVAKQLNAALNERHYKISVNSMVINSPSEPNEKESKQLTSPYSVEVRNDSLISRLPLAGSIPILTYGGVGTKHLGFKAPISSYQEEVTKKGKRIIEIGVKHVGIDFLYVIEVAANGNSFINIRAGERERVSYGGHMEFRL